MDEPTAFLEAWRSGTYLLAIAILVGGLTRLARAYEPLWASLPDDKKRWVPVVLAGLAAFAQAVFDASQSAPAALVATKAVLTGIVSALSAIGGHHFLNATKHSERTPTGRARERIYLDDPDRTPTDHGVHCEAAPITVQSPSRIARAVHEQFAKLARRGAPVALLTLVALMGCSSMKPGARTVVEAGRILCETFFAERAGVSVEDAARLYCATDKQLRPFLDQALAAQQAAGAAAAPAE